MSTSLRALFTNAEFQSALVRLAVWCFAAVYIGLGAHTGYYAVEQTYYNALFGSFLVVFAALLISVKFRPHWPARRYFSLTMDILATSLCIYMTKDVVSPFYLLYIWIFISYGTRYGKSHLITASVMSLVAYAVLLLALGQWTRYTFEAVFFLLLLVMLPLYQYTLLRKLHQARLDAEQSSRAKSAFMSTMTHELRTPLSGIMGMAGLLRKTNLNEEQKEYLQAIGSSADALDNLIGDVLDLSNIEANGLKLVPEQISLQSYLHDLLMSVAGQASTKGIELICSADWRLPAEVQVDAFRLRQILLNLLSNAIKFTQKGEIELHVTTPRLDELTGKDWILRFDVRDTGIGLTPAQQQRVFERFWQGDDSPSASVGGVGLGTAISKTLVESMGGRISVQSIAGKGSCFRVELPVQAEQAMTSRAEAHHDLLQGCSLLLFESHPRALALLVEACDSLGADTYPVKSVSALPQVMQQLEQRGGCDLALVADSVNGVDSQRIARLLRDQFGDTLPVIYMGCCERRQVDDHPASRFMLKPWVRDGLVSCIKSLSLDLPASSSVEADQEKADDQPIKVLMAEDNRINARVLETLLDDLGCLVSWAKDGEEALKLALKQSFDIAFVDLRMPKIDGLCFTRDYRAAEQSDRKMPIIALTANATADAHRQCQDAGMDGFLTKPVDTHELAGVLRSYL